ncbi:MAG: YraN family protein [Cytophagales bacterium]|nr:YraN family protein [Bernardetiaceae bacterium]MDW8204926.1 YraN family protein [Cytophagales bacterium]
MTRKQKGEQGEQMAIAYLEANQYKILKRNYRPEGTEIDIIAQYLETLVFVEVKTRRKNDFGYPESAVNMTKQQRIKLAAEHFIAEHDWHGDIRFDIIAITWSDPPELVHFQDAFY